MRWSNVPLPEPHLIGLGLGLVAQLVAPWHLPSSSAIGRVVGGAAIVVSLAWLVWTVSAAERVDLGRPEQLVTAGPYRLSRNPMYVGWTLVYIGVGLALDSAWLLLLLPAVLVATHLAVVREEHRLSDLFGATYQEYRTSVRRYL